MYRYLFLFLLVFLPATGWAQGKNFSTAAKPGWLVPYKPDPSLSTNTNEISEGYYQLLYEQQHHVEQKTVYSHIVRQIVSEAGIQNGSQINVYYNPEYEKLQFHEVLVRRNGQVINRLSPGKFKIIQKEEELSRHIYSGAYNAFYLVEDVRKGDQIEYAYSITGENPIYANKYSQTIYLSSSEPITNFYKALIVSPARKLSFRSFFNAPAPVKKTIHGLDLYEWNLADNAALMSFEEYQPSWYTGFPYYQVSEFKNWKDVIDWAAKVNDIPLTGTEMQARVAQLKKFAGDDKEKYLLEAIRFVQDDIRYMGIEMGEYSYRPNQPEKVCRQRFGDCKDKSLLLCALLRANGITAHMAYVDTELKGKIAEGLPSPDRFDHVIAKVLLNDQTYWVDATFSYQRGGLKHRYNPEYEKALVLTDGSVSLTDIPQKDFGKLVVNEDFVIDDFVNDFATLTVYTEYTGLYADNLRDEIANSSMQQLEEDYVNFYKNIYGKVEKMDSLKITDIDSNNLIRVKERYKILEPWKIDSANNYALSFSTTAHILKSKLLMADADRKTPITLLFPNALKYNISIRFPENWSLEEKAYTLNSAYYNFAFDSKLKGRVVTMQYTFNAKRDHVPAEGLKQYISDMDQLVQATGYQFTYNNAKTAGTKSKTAAASGVNWLVVFLALASGGFFVYLATKYYRRSIPTSYASYEAWDLGGWLILLGLVVVSSPIRIMINVMNMEAFGNAIWARLSDAYPDKNPSLLQLFLIAEVLGNIFLLVSVCLLPILFFRKRDLFPRTMCFVIVFDFLFILLDYTFADVVFGSHLLVSNSADYITPAIGGAIMLTYLLRSERVKNTFVIPYEEE